MSGKQSLVKKEWLRQRFAEELVFYRSRERGKCFIEYIPAEYAWLPIQAEGYLYINCLWVSGSMKGHGYSNDLLAECIRDAKRRGERVCAPCPPKDGSVSFSPTRSTWRTRASQRRIPLHAGSNCCICLLFPVQSRRNSRTAPNSPLWRRAALCSITRISVPSPTTGCREWWRRQAHHIPLKVIHVTSREQAQNVRRR